MDFKLKVTGTSQNSTALGIMHAYMRLFPDSTLEDLQRVFPNEIAPDNGVKQIFQPIKQAKNLNDKSESFTGYFATVQRPPLTLSDGSQVAVCQVWTSSSLARLVEKAKEFGIDAEVCKGQKPDVGFRIDTLEESAGASEVKDSKLKVTGTSQNSTALGIMHAYMRLFPDSTLEDLQRVFPNEIAPDNGVKQIFQPIKQAKNLNDKSESFTGYFATVQRPPLTLSDGSQVAVCQVWTSSSLARLVEKAKEFGIDAEVCKGQKPDVGFRIDTLEESAGASEVKDSKVCSSEADEKKAKIYAPIFAFLFFQGGVWSGSRKQNEEAFTTVAKELGINQDCFLKHVHSLIDPFSMIEEGDGSGEDDADYDDPILDEGYGIDNWDEEDDQGRPNLLALAYDEDNLSEIPSEEQDTFLHAAVNFLLSKNTIEDYGLRGICKIWETINCSIRIELPIFEMLKMVVATAKKRDYQVWIND